jgi:integrase
MAVKEYKPGRWLVEFKLRGQRVLSRRPRGSTKAEAEEYEAIRRSAIYRQIDLGHRPDVSLETAVFAWLKEVNKGRKSEQATSDHARRLAPFVKDRQVLDIPRVADMVRMAPCLAVATKNRRICILKAVAKFAWDKGWTAENLSSKAKLLPGNNAREIYLSKAQLAHLLSHCPCEATRAWITIAAWTGLRRSEIMRLTQNDICEQVLKVRMSKSGEPRRVPILPQVREALLYVPFAFCVRYYSIRFERARDAAGFPWLHFHDLRHTFGSWLGAQGVDALAIADLMGHKDLRATKRYVHFNDAARKRAMRRIA